MSSQRDPKMRTRYRVPSSGSSRRPHFTGDTRVARRLQQLANEGEPLSLAERIASDVSQPPSNGSDNGTKPHFSITQLQQMTHGELVGIANQIGIASPESRSHRDLVHQVLRQHIKTCGIMDGEGTLEILPDGFGFLRSADSSYLTCPDDIYVSPSQIRKFNLRTGSTIAGHIRPPKSNEKYFALLRVKTINHQNPGDQHQLRYFDDLTPVHPNRRIILEHHPADLSTRVVDMLAPIGFGQRALIVSPPRAGKTLLMQAMARAVLKNYPEAFVMVLLVDERPEEVTDMEREVQGKRCEVVSSTFDESAERHVQVADMVLEKAKRLVEAGTDVVVFLDSITRLSRAWNSNCPQSGKTLSGGLDANAMQRPKAFFGSARQVEEGGSLSIVATALIDTGSKMDDVIFEEFKGTGNLEIVLDRQLVDRRIFPAIDISRTGTRREEKLLDPEELKRINIVRRITCEINPPDAMEKLVERLQKTQSNAEFLLSIGNSGIL